MGGAVTGYVRSRAAHWQWIASEYKAAWVRACENPKRAIVKGAIVTALSFAFYMMFVHGPAAAAGPGSSCATWAATQAGSPGALSQALTDMTGGQTITEWMNNALRFVGVVFWALMVVQITQDLIDYLFQTAGSGSLAGFVGQYGRILVMNLLLATLFTNMPTIVYDFFSAAGEVGQAVTGAQKAPWFSDIFTFQPGLVADEGACVSDEMDATFADLAQKKLTFSWTDIGHSMQSAVEYVTAWIDASLIGATVVNIAYLIVAIVFTFVSLEVFFVGALGIISLGGMSHRALWFMPMMYRTACFGLFMKVAALGAISAFGTNEADTWASMIAGVQSMDKLVPVAKEVMYGAIGFALIAGFLPGIIGKHFHGGHMGPSATLAIGRVGNSSVQNVTSGIRGAARSAGSASPSGSPSSSSSAQRTPTMSGTP